VIASEGGGTRELVVDGETGFLVAQKSPERLAEKIEKLLNDAGLRAKMGLMGKQMIQREFSIERMTSEHIRLYERLARS
jgi:glycosyltransferase involved in cell wall biosynthesis